jgi:hypothetical protein
MPDELWRAAVELADAFAEAPKVQSFRRAFRPPTEQDDFRARVSEVTALYSPLRTHSILLGVRMNQLPVTATMLQTPADEAWLKDAVQVGTAFQMVLEFLRSRLPGYPSLRLPHLRNGSPYVPEDPFFVRGYPWEPEMRRLGLQLQDVPSMAALGGGDCRDQILNLLYALQERPAWRRFAAARETLTEADHQALSQASRKLSERTKDQSLDEEAGDYLLARYQRREAVLEEVVTGTHGRVAEYLRAFEAIDELITVVAAVVDASVTSDGLLGVHPYRMDVGAGDDLRAVELAVVGDSPMHNPGEVLVVEGPHPALSGVVYPIAITHRWGRSDDPSSSRMIVSGYLATGSG